VNGQGQQRISTATSGALLLSINKFATQGNRNNTTHYGPDQRSAESSNERIETSIVRTLTCANDGAPSSSDARSNPHILSLITLQANLADTLSVEPALGWPKPQETARLTNQLIVGRSLKGAEHAVSSLHRNAGIRLEILHGLPVSSLCLRIHPNEEHDKHRRKYLPPALCWNECLNNPPARQENLARFTAIHVSPPLLRPLSAIGKPGLQEKVSGEEP
jgi:hypothetical protein